MSRLAAFIYARRLVEEDAPPNEILDLAVLVERSVRTLISELEKLDDDATDESVQYVFYEAGKQHFASDLRYWFKILYQMLLDQPEGPRLGQFTRIMTIDWVTHRLEKSIQDHWQSS